MSKVQLQTYVSVLPTDPTFNTDIPVKQQEEKASSSSSGSIGADQFQDLLTQILSKLGIYMAQVMNGGAKTMSDQSSVASAMANEAQKSANDYEDQLQKTEEAQKKAHSGFWGTLGDIFGNKWVQIALTAVVGLLLCESPMGFAMLAGVIALQASGALDKASTALGNAMGGSPVANMFASLIITGGLTLGSGLLEGAGMAAISKALPAIFAKEGTAVAEKTVVAEGAKLAEQEASKEAATAATNASEDATKTSTQYFKYGYGTAFVAANALASTNLFENLALTCGASKNTAAEVGAILTAIVSIALVLGSAAASNGTQMLSALSKNWQQTIKYGSIGAQGVLNAGNDTFNIHAGVTNLDYANAVDQLAPIQGEVTMSGTLAQYYNQELKQTEESLGNTTKEEATILSQIRGFADSWSVVAGSFVA